MRTLYQAITLSAAILGSLEVAFAQDTSMQGDSSDGPTLPAACQTAKAPAMAGMESMESMMEGMDEDKKALMQGMMETHAPMMQGMMVEDTDVAFACAMIPHHQGAINMAEVELQNGDSDEMKQLAQKIIDDQKKEIEQLTRWVEEQSR